MKEEKEGDSLDLLSKEEILTLKEIIGCVKKTKEELGGSIPKQERFSHSVTKEEVSRANKRLKLDLDMRESDLSSLVFTALCAMQEIYGVSVQEGSLDEKFREAVDAVSLILLERNKQRSGEGKRLGNPVILNALDQE